MNLRNRDPVGDRRVVSGLTRRLIPLVLVGSLSGCDSGSSQTARGAAVAGGTIVISASADADILLPPLTITVQGKQITDQVFDNLADIGDQLNTVGDTGFRPRLARSWRWAPDSSWIDFALHPEARWHDGRPVTSDDVRFTFALVKDVTLGSPLAGNLEDVDSVATPDPLTARVWLAAHPPSTFFRVASQIVILPAHILSAIKPTDLRTAPFARHPVGSGRFRFARWIPATSVSLTADTVNYRGRPNADQVIWLVSQDYNSAALRFMAGDADFLDVVKPEFLDRVRAAGRRVDTRTPSLNYGYVAFNLRRADGKAPHPILADRSVRRALVMAVNREALVRNALDTLGLVAQGPVTRAMSTSDSVAGLPYDGAAAAQALDAAGWRRSASGIRSRNGIPLGFSLLVPSSSAIRGKFAVLLQEQWRRVGADVRIESIELSAFGERLDAHRFDAMLNAWQIDPDPASVRDEWMSPEKRPGGINFGSYRNPYFDAVVDSAAREVNPAVSAALYRKAYRKLTDDAPALWLYELRNAFGVSDRLQTSGMRPDAWWAGLSEWTVGGR